MSFSFISESVQFKSKGEGPAPCSIIAKRATPKSTKYMCIKILYQNSLIFAVKPYCTFIKIDSTWNHTTDPCGKVIFVRIFECQFIYLFFDKEQSTLPRLTCLGTCCCLESFIKKMFKCLQKSIRFWQTKTLQYMSYAEVNKWQVPVQCVNTSRLGQVTYLLKTLYSLKDRMCWWSSYLSANVLL